MTLLPSAGEALVLDGGLSNQLADQGCDLDDPLWSARLLADAPEQVEAAHAAYARAGAQVLTTASYQATYEGFARRGIGRARATALLRRSVELARSAAASGSGSGAGTGSESGAGPEDGVRTGAAGPGGRVTTAGSGVRASGPGAGSGVPAAGSGAGVRVAASVGPYGAMLADGSEYRGRYGLSVRELAAFHRPRIEALAEAGPDVLALETVPDVDEAEAMLRAAEGCGVPVWLSYTVAGDRTRAGQPLAEAFAVAAGREDVVAVGVNCCSPQDADAAVPLAARITGKPVVVYPNSGQGWDPAARAWTGSAEGPAGLAGHAVRWREQGARIIGGCCRIGPPAIAAVARALRP